jgi:hypothetical protein
MNDEIEREERAIYLVIALAAIPVLIGVAIQGDAIDAGATISLGCVVLALIGLLQLRRARLPKVIARRATGTPRRPR